MAPGADALVLQRAAPQVSSRTPTRAGSLKPRVRKATRPLVAPFTERRAEGAVFPAGGFLSADQVHGD